LPPPHCIYTPWKNILESAHGVFLTPRQFFLQNGPRLPLILPPGGVIFSPRGKYYFFPPPYGKTSWGRELFISPKDYIPLSPQRFFENNAFFIGKFKIGTLQKNLLSPKKIPCRKKGTTKIKRGPTWKL